MGEQFTVYTFVRYLDLVLPWERPHPYSVAHMRRIVRHI